MEKKPEQIREEIREIDRKLDVLESERKRIDLSIEAAISDVTAEVLSLCNDIEMRLR